MNLPLVLIGCYGNSTQVGVAFNGAEGGPKPGADGTVESIVPEPAPQALQRLLQAKYGAVVVVENHGISGTTCTNWMLGGGAVPRPWAVEMAQSAADIVLIDLGINDMQPELQANYDALVTIAENAGNSVLGSTGNSVLGSTGKRVVIQTPNQMDIPGDPAGINDGRADIERQVHANHPNSLLVDFAAYTTGLGAAWWKQLSYSIPWLGGPWAGIHPNQEGYQTMAAQAFEVLDPVVGAMLAGPVGKLAVAPPASATLWWNTANCGAGAGGDQGDPGIVGVDAIDMATGLYLGGGSAADGVNYTFCQPPWTCKLPAGGNYRFRLIGYVGNAWHVLGQKDVAT